jgi:dephospho-CoA kinase
MARYARRPASGLSRPRGPWKHGPVPVIGLIGGIGAGKSRVANAFAERGAKVLDADAIGHALLEQTPAREQVIERFGARILDREAPADGPPRIHRRALGAIVFEQPAAMRDLESILHPRIRKTFLRAIDRAVRSRKEKAIVLDAAVLLEAGWNDLCDTVVFVDAPREQRLVRLKAQRGWSPETLSAREQAQWPLEQKRRLADHVLPNDADPAALDAAADRLWRAILASPHSGSARPRGQSSSARGGPPHAGPARRR